MKLVILDRDGTINEGRTDFVSSPEEWVPLPGALEAIARLNHAGFHVVVVSNQPGLGRGLFDVSTLNAMHTKMHKALAAVGGRVDVIFYCPHGPEEKCNCRMPAPGLFEQIADRYGMSLAGVPVVGDRLRDLQAGHSVGCEPHLVLTGAYSNGVSDPLPPDFPAGTQVHADLAAFAAYLVERDALALPPAAPRAAS
ncbi:D-glycero-beta-D-manno-heptose 1,7-bisphosphate 7-phosphatase [Xylophilus rhododendri]|uniref:D-glycero-beta-D-manno-heptose-1,7-bisphosphate 7-phosphatase n=1 Tax=Xylophilus rhododendri TaxID=2697032 RepID=A0A857J6C6_9BURK|nr:D-glycero-beta-D-manno-heptose 1,7-bisphosphate 7-phosphatase [Xylophilus rhododendri]QHI99277.1 D-glycero-beta-D-manno-heptose 1,7-bisphosphate 7-phosphatase [Xylophilus rhododendri]